MPRLMHESYLSHSACTMINSGAFSSDGISACPTHNTQLSIRQTDVTAMSHIYRAVHTEIYDDDLMPLRVAEAV